MNTDMNQYLIFRFASTVVRKITVYQLCCAGLAHSPFVLTEHISSLDMYNTDTIAINKPCKLNFTVFYHVLSYEFAAGLSGLFLV